MKKISVISILSVLVFPAFAEPVATELYGDPANIQKADTPAVDVAKTEQPSDLQSAEKTNSTEIAEQKVEEQKIEEKKVKKTKEQKVIKQNDIVSQSDEKEVIQEQKKQIEYPEFKEQKVKTASNPKTRFPHGLQLGLGVSPTSGLNAFIGYNNKNFNSFWAKRFGVRLDFATYSPIKNTLNNRINSAIGEEGIEIDDNLKLNNVNLNAKHFGALIDFYPFGNTWFLGGLRVSGGYMTGNLELNADIVGTKKVGEIEFELGGKKYSYSGNEMRGKSTLNWKYSGPYLGTGFDLGLFYGFKLYMDAGVVFADNHAKIDLNVPLTGLKDVAADLPVDGNAALETAYQTAKKEALTKAQQELDKVDYYPIVKLGFMYRF